MTTAARLRAKAELQDIGITLAALGFIEAMDFQNVGAVVEFLEKPWKWRREYASWIDFGRPAADDPSWALWHEGLYV